MAKRKSTSSKAAAKRKSARTTSGSAAKKKSTKRTKKTAKRTTKTTKRATKTTKTKSTKSKATKSAGAAAKAKKKSAKKAPAKAASGRSRTAEANSKNSAGSAPARSGNSAPKNSASTSTEPSKSQGNAAPAHNATNGDDGAASINSKPVRLPKSPLTKRQLNHFRSLLLAKRAEVVGDVTNLTDEARLSSQSAVGGSSHVPIHMADLGSDNWEQEFTFGLIANERTLVREIDEALARIANRTYGICLGTHEPIPVERLEAKPWAKYCIQYATLLEEGRAS